jgi:hypothetical protein
VGGWGVGGHGHVDRDERSQLQRVVHLGTSFHKNITQELADRHGRSQLVVPGLPG